MPLSADSCRLEFSMRRTRCFAGRGFRRPERARGEGEQYEDACHAVVCPIVLCCNETDMMELGVGLIRIGREWGHVRRTSLGARGDGVLEHALRRVSAFTTPSELRLERGAHRQIRSFFKRGRSRRDPVATNSASIGTRRGRRLMWTIRSMRCSGAWTRAWSIGTSDVLELTRRRRSARQPDLAARGSTPQPWSEADGRA